MIEAFRYSFEGLDGAGKTTNARMLQEQYRQKGYRVVALSTPSNTELGDHIRRNLGRLSSEEKIGLFIQDIWDSISQCPPGLDLILWDRYTDSFYSSNEELLVLEPERIRRIDATQSLPLVFASIATSIDSHVVEMSGFKGGTPLSL